ncbi:MAG: Ig-like domain-containing protein, partial [Lachnospiraceae bacterium]|nr:Ig-like domain-containing protein [Lachnospiraceae bacterium]
MATAKSMVFMRTSEVRDVTGGDGTTDPTTPPDPETPNPPAPTDPPETPTVTGVTLDSSTLALKTGETGTLTATVEPAGAENKKITANSSDTKVATVTFDAASGKITVTAVGAGT